MPDRTQGGQEGVLLAPPGSSWLLLAPPGSSWFLLARSLDSLFKILGTGPLLGHAF